MTKQPPAPPAGMTPEEAARIDAYLDDLVAGWPAPTAELIAHLRPIFADDRPAVAPRRTA